jgi:hypothetical protein
MAEIYKCQHGGPGELAVVDKNIFVAAYVTNLDEAHKVLVQGLGYEELLCTELVVFEELLKNDTLKALVDDSLMKLYFGMATDDLLKAQVEPARINARMGVYIAMCLAHGDKFWQMIKEPAEVQKITLKDMYTALGKLTLDQGVAQVLNVQTPCDCLEQALPAFNDKKKTRNRCGK